VRSGPPVLSTRALNRALLARQLLLERADLSIEAAVEQVGGLQMHPSPGDGRSLQCQTWMTARPGMLM